MHSLYSLEFIFEEILMFSPVCNLPYAAQSDFSGYFPILNLFGDAYRFRKVTLRLHLFYYFLELVWAGVVTGHEFCIF